MANVDIVLNGVDEASGVIGGVGDALGEMATGALRYLGELAVQGFGELTSALGEFVTDAMAAQQQQARLNALLKSAGAESGFTASVVDALATQFKDLAGGSDEAVKAIEEMGIRMGTISADQMPSFIQTTLDLAAATGTDATNAARLLAQAYDDPASALSRFNKMGIRFDTELQDQIKNLIKAGKTGEAYNLMLGRLGDATAGAASAQADTFAGKLGIMQEHLADAGKAIGEALLPALSTLFDQYIAPNIPKVEAFAQSIANFITGLPNLGEVVDTIITLFQQIGPALEAGTLDYWVQSLSSLNVPQPVIDFFTWLAGALPVVKPLFDGFVASFNALVAGDGEAFFTTLTTTLENLWTNAKPYFDAFWASISKWITDNAPVLKENLLTWARELANWLSDNWPLFEAGARLWWNKFAVWIEAQATTLSDKVRTDWGPAILAWLNVDAPVLAEKLGVLIGQFTVWMVETGAPMIASIFPAIIGALTGAGVSANDPNSPQFHGARIAQALVDGVKQGIGDKAAEVQQHILDSFVNASLVGMIISRITSAIQGAANDAINSYTPVAPTVPDYLKNNSAPSGGTSYNTTSWNVNISSAQSTENIVMDLGLARLVAGA